MSDPAKTPAEIEDVLASIRRLVSDSSAGSATRHPQTTRHAPEPAQADSGRHETARDDTPASQQAPEAVDRLVLTPSFRVTDPEDPWVPVEAAKPAKPPLSLLTDPENSKRNDVDWKPDDRLLAFEEVGAPTDHAEDDGQDVTGGFDGDVSSDFESETGDDNWPNTEAEAALLSLVARREPLAVVPEGTPDEAAPEQAHDDTPQDAEQTDLAESDTDNVPDTAEAPEGEAAEQADDAGDTGHGEAEISALEALVASAIRAEDRGETLEDGDASGESESIAEGDAPDAASSQEEAQGQESHHDQDDQTATTEQPETSEASEQDDEAHLHAPDVEHSDGTDEGEDNQTDVTETAEASVEHAEQAVDTATQEDGAQDDRGHADGGQEDGTQEDSTQEDGGQEHQSEDDGVHEGEAQEDSVPDDYAQQDAAPDEGHADQPHEDEHPSEEGASVEMPELEEAQNEHVEAAQADPAEHVDDLGDEPSVAFPDADGENAHGDQTHADDPIGDDTVEDGAEDLLDEETLRAIIVDVVREELQGVLGQRITRNVRKMVRREVRLAMAAENLE